MMSLPISLEQPIVVVVSGDSWDAYSLNDPITDRDQWLFTVLESMNGVDENVEPGAYHFNAVKFDATCTLVQLEPIKTLGCSRIFHGL
jgi:hypothetical protein